MHIGGVEDEKLIKMQPGCSSIGELLQENGPIWCKPGTFGPVQNPWSWHHLSNVVWIEQSVGTGFSRAGNGYRRKRYGKAVHGVLESLC